MARRATNSSRELLAGIGVACLLILIFILPAVKLPVGLVAIVIVATLIARRAFATQSVAA